MRRGFGAVILGLLVLLALFGPLITPYGVNERDPVFAPDAQGNLVRIPPPHPPSWKHLLGTDGWGFDVLTRMLYGARYTMGFIVGVALVRLMLGFVAAAAAHLLSHAKRSWKPQGVGHHPVGTAVPEFVVAYVALGGIAFSPPMRALPFAVLQGVLISIVGLPGLIPTLRARMARAASQPFVEAQVAAGAGSWHIFTHTVVPAIARDLWLLLSHESLLVALVTGELAIFHIFVGGTIRTFDPVEFYSRSHEWVGMAGENSGEILGGVYRLILVPLAGYLIVVGALALLSEGARSPVVRHRSGSPARRLVSMFMSRGEDHAQGR